MSLEKQDTGRWGPDAQRLAAAIAISLALHVLLAASWHPRQTTLEPERTTVIIAQVVTIEHRPKPTPTPAARPRHAAVIAPAHVATAKPGRAAPRHHVKRAAQPPPRVRTRYHSTRKPAPIVMGGQGAGATTGKAVAGGAGPGGSGVGQGNSGAGAGAAAANEPCGYVEFVDIGGLFRVDKQRGGLLVNIRMLVHFPDGHTESVDLDYPWHYADDAANPWSEENLKNPDFPVPFQWPPASRASAQPALVRYVMLHTTAEGYTKLKDCPAEPSAGPGA
ncbi:hypothetical protein EPN52_03975 [bacterium]|nr:MAG: hypothetical protein EPN52_03975 [bacterium]